MSTTGFNPNLLDNGTASAASFGTIPKALAHQWALRNAGSNAKAIRLFEDGKHFIALRVTTATFTADQQSMKLGGADYDRVTSEPRGINGLWRKNGSTTDFWFFDSGAAYEIVGSSLVYQFTVDQNVGGNPDHIQLWPLRTIAEADTSTIRFSPIYWTQSFVANYTIVGDVLTMDFSGSVFVYDKVPFGPAP